MDSGSFLKIHSLSLNSHQKPQLSSMLKQEASTSQVSDQQLQYFFRYHIVSLIKGCKKNCYDHKESKTALRRHSNSQSQNNQAGLINSLGKLVLIKSKYRHREKINFNRSQALKYMKYSMEQLRATFGTKQYNQLYEDLFDELCPEDKKDTERIYSVDPSFGEQMFRAYRKKHNLSPTTKIFVVTNYDDLAQHFLDAGWHSNPDNQSLIYDFKYITKAKQIDHINIRDNQINNHFQKNNSIATKYGLCRNIKNLILQGEDYNVFYPRCFDLYDVAEFQDWVEEFKFCKVIAILKSALQVSEEEMKKNFKLLEICLQCGKRYGLSIKQKIQLIQLKEYPIITTEEWNLISNPKTIPEHKMSQQEETIKIQQLRDQIKHLLSKVRKVDTQYNINKENIWIVKPGSRSRGRGIKAFSDLKQIINYVAGKEDISWVVQKYLQNPLIIKNRKFDIRQWVAITDLKPLRIWIYKEFYVRFSAQQYSTANIKNRFAHLTNNSIAKYSQNFDNEQIKGNMYYESELEEYLTQTTGDKNTFSEIKKQIKDNIVKSIISVSDILSSPKKNSIELFGYDFMIDTDMRSWLIEVNSSPSMDYSTHVTTKLVPQALKGFGQLVTQYIMAGRQIKQEIGGWQLVYNK